MQNQVNNCPHESQSCGDTIALLIMWNNWNVQRSGPQSQEAATRMGLWTPLIEGRQEFLTPRMPAETIPPGDPKDLL
jgi:hypothetical protein